MEIIELIFRNESIFMVKTDITGLIDSDWFLSVILKWQNGSNQIQINEDKDTSMSLIETLRFNKLIVYPNVSLDYMSALADKWCLPNTIIKMINDVILINNYQVVKNKLNLIDNMVFKCINCKAGFKMSENTSDSCKFHPLNYDVNVLESIFKCCGGVKDGPVCTVGYHTLCYTDRETYFSLSHIIPK